MKQLDLRRRNKHHNKNGINSNNEVFRRVGPSWSYALSSMKSIKGAYVAVAVLMGVSIGVQLPLIGDEERANTPGSSTSLNESPTLKKINNSSKRVISNKSVTASNTTGQRISASATPTAERTTSAADDGSKPTDEHTPGATYTAPAPISSDVSGSDQDQYYIPVSYFNHPTESFGEYYVNGVPKEGKKWYSTKGASKITITTDHDSGTWTFYYSDEATGVEATNKYSVDISTDGCKNNEGVKYRKISATFTNVADETGRAVPQVDPYVHGNGQGEGLSAPQYDIQDGHTAIFTVGASQDRPGLPPGKYTADFRVAKYAGKKKEIYIGKSINFTVPKCDSQSGQQGTTNSNPQAKLKQVRSSFKPMMKAILKTKQAGKTRFVIKKANGKLVKRVKVQADSRKVVRFNAQKGTKYKVVVKGKKLAVSPRTQ